MARSQSERRRRRHEQAACAPANHFVVDVLEPVELDAPPIAGLVLEPVVLLDMLPVLPVLPLPEVEPVPVAPIEDVPPLPLVDEPVDVSALPVVVEGEVDDGEVVDGEVDAVEEFDEGEVDDGVVLLVVDEVLDSRLVQAPSEMAATTARAAAVAWVEIIFIRKLLERIRDLLA